jgi:hypothetical protein
VATRFAASYVQYCSLVANELDDKVFDERYVTIEERLTSLNNLCISRWIVDSMISLPTVPILPSHIRDKAKQFERGRGIAFAPEI